MCKLLDTVIKTVNKGIIKSHSRCKGIDVSVLKHRHTTISVDEKTISITIGSFVESFELTSHWKSGSLYMHWIKLNQCLVKLSLLIGDFHSWMFDFTNPDRISDILGVSHDGELTVKEVRAQYRRLSWAFHPDHGGDPDLMRELTFARDATIDFINGCFE